MATGNSASTSSFGHESLSNLGHVAITGNPSDGRLFDRRLPSTAAFRHRHQATALQLRWQLSCTWSCSSGPRGSRHQSNARHQVASDLTGNQVAQSYSTVGNKFDDRLREYRGPGRFGAQPKRTHLCYEADVGHSTLPHGHGDMHTCGMQVCEFTAVALTIAPLPPPRSPRRAQASTSPRPA